MKSDEVLRGLLEAEYAAVYAYGVLGARLGPAQRQLALSAFDAHRASRDDLRGLIGPPAPAPAPAYDVQVGTPAEALQLAVRIESDLEGRWRDLVAATADAGLRRRGVQGLQDAAVRAALWRRFGGVLPMTEPFPGQDAGSPASP